MSEDIHEQLLDYLRDAHSIEEQALAQLRDAPKIAGGAGLSHAFADHLTETEGHEQLTRSLLEGRDAGPSRFKDAVMAVGGKGFVWFARLQPDTPGKLAAHALSYEALEHGSYEMLARIAERAGEQPVVDAARSIAVEEKRMMERLEGLFDESVNASLEDTERPDLSDKVRSFLADAHALEEQAIKLLERAVDHAGSPELAKGYEDHLAETREHARLVEERLHALGGKPSMLKDAMMKLGGLNWATFFAAQPDTPGKLAVFARAFEYLEIGGYEQLKRVAQRDGDRQTVDLVTGILLEERAAAQRLASSFDEAAAAALQAQAS
jgi:ferritin-like metal-binding protein YciE